MQSLGQFAYLFIALALFVDLLSIQVFHNLGRSILFRKRFRVRPQYLSVKEIRFVQYWRADCLDVIEWSSEVENG